MGQTDFTGAGRSAAADQTDIRDSMVRSSEWSPGNQRFPCIQQTADAEQLGGFDGFVKAHGGKNGGDATGQHGFAGSWRADHQQIVTAGSRDLQSPLGVLLAPHFGKIFTIFILLLK